MSETLADQMKSAVLVALAFRPPTNVSGSQTFDRLSDFDEPYPSDADVIRH